jgi:hypothetical protein
MRIKIFALCVLLTSCRKLSEETQEGKGTFSMLVNGAVWNKGICFYPCPNAAYHKPQGYISVFIRGPYSEGLNFYFKIDKNSKNAAIIEKRLDFDQSNDSSDHLCYYKTFLANKNDDCYTAYYFKDSIPNNIRITKFDTIIKIVSGTFYMTMIDRYGDKKTIKSGRFDLQFNALPPQ